MSDINLSVRASIVNHPWRYALLVCAAVMLFGTAYSLYLGDAVRFSDERQYLRLANNLRDLGMYTGNGDAPTAYRAPGYAFSLAAAGFLGDGLFVLRMLNFTALAICLVLLFKLVEAEANGIGGFVAVSIAALNPVNLFTAGALYPQTVAAMLFMAIMVMIILRPTSLKFWWSGLVGLIMGSLLLTVPAFIFACAIILLWAALNDWPRGLRMAAAMLLGVVLVVTPWAVRNYHHFDAFIPFATQGGNSLWQANNKNAHWSRNVSEIGFAEFNNEVKALRLSEVETDRFYKNAAWEWISENKLKAGLQYAGRIVHYFSLSNSLATNTKAMDAAQWVSRLYYSGLFATVAVRLLLWRRFPLSRVEQALIALYLLNAIFSSIFITRIRYRIPFDYLLVAVIGIFFGRLFGASRLRSGSLAGSASP